MPETSNLRSSDNGPTTSENTGSSSSGQFDRIRAVAGYSILLTCFVLGATIATFYWLRSIGAIQKQLTVVEEELAVIKAEYQQYREQKLRAAQNVLIEQTVIVKVPIGTTATILGESLSISVITTEESNSGYKTTAILKSPGSPDQEIRHANIGSITTYTTEKSDFNIVVLEANSFLATFLITPKES